MDLLARNRVVSEIGFPSYDVYLESELWGRIRARVLRKSNRKCCCCDGRANQVHHSKYTADNLSGKSEDGLHPICADCHTLVHFDDSNFIDMRQSGDRLDVFIEAKHREVPDVVVPQQPVQKKTKKPWSPGERTPRKARSRAVCVKCSKERNPTKVNWEGVCGVCVRREARQQKQSQQATARPARTRLSHSMLNVKVNQTA